MAEYIEREALLEHIAGLSIIITGLSRGRNQLAEFGIRYKNSILRGINNFPDADVAPVVHGQWDDSGRYTFPGGSTAVRCTNCGCALTESEYRLNNWNYCPVCGAKMDGSTDHEAN